MYNRLTGLAAMLCLFLVAGDELSAQEASTAQDLSWNELNHIYFRDCTSSRDSFRSICPRVEYSWASENRIGLVLKDPQQAAAIPELALKAVSDDLAAPCAKACLKLVAVEEKNPQVGIYEVIGFKGAEQLMWLARRLSELPQVKIGGLLVREGSAGELAIFVDEITVRVQKEIELPLSPGEEALLRTVGLRLVSADPFDAEFKFLLASISAEDIAKAINPMVQVDALACVIATGLEEPSASTASWCKEVVRDLMGPSAQALEEQTDVQKQKQAEGQARNPFAQSLEALAGAWKGASKDRLDCDAPKSALDHFACLGPISVEPTLIPVATAGPRPGFLDWLKTQKAREDGTTFALDLSSVSNRTDDADSSKLSAGISGSRGVYPGEFSFGFGGQIQFGDSEVKEDVTTLQVSYDRYFRRWFEVYAFTERFTNNFLSIDQRWEGGAGALFEYDLHVKSRDGYCDDRLDARGRARKEIRATRGTRDRLDHMQEVLRQEIFRQGYVSPKTRDDYCKYKEGIAKQKAVFQLGLAVTGLVDYEQPSALTIVARSGEADKKPATFKATPEAIQRYRYALRPSITWRPNDRVMLELLSYFKVDPDPEDDLLHTGTDVRTESTFKAEIQLSDEPKVSLTATITRYEDSRPPRLSALDIYDQAVKSITFVGERPTDPRASSLSGSLTGNTEIQVKESATLEGFLARDRHTVLNFGLKLKF